MAMYASFKMLAELSFILFNIISYIYMLTDLLWRVHNLPNVSTNYMHAAAQVETTANITLTPILQKDFVRVCHSAKA